MRAAILTRNLERFSSGVRRAAGHQTPPGWPPARGRGRIIGAKYVERSDARPFACFAFQRALYSSISPAASRRRVLRTRLRAT